MAIFGGPAAPVAPRRVPIELHALLAGRGGEVVAELGGFPSSVLDRQLLARRDGQIGSVVGRETGAPSGASRRRALFLFLSSYLCSLKVIFSARTLPHELFANGFSRLQTLVGVCCRLPGLPFPPAGTGFLLALLFAGLVFCLPSANGLEDDFRVNLGSEQWGEDGGKLHVGITNWPTTQIDRNGDALANFDTGGRTSTGDWVT